MIQEGRDARMAAREAQEKWFYTSSCRLAMRASEGSFFLKLDNFIQMKSFKGEFKIGQGDLSLNDIRACIEIFQSVRIKFGENLVKYSFGDRIFSSKDKTFLTINRQAKIQFQWTTIMRQDIRKSFKLNFAEDLNKETSLLYQIKGLQKKCGDLERKNKTANRLIGLSTVCLLLLTFYLMISNKEQKSFHLLPKIMKDKSKKIQSNWANFFKEKQLSFQQEIYEKVNDQIQAQKTQTQQLRNQLQKMNRQLQEKKQQTQQLKNQLQKYREIKLQQNLNAESVIQEKKLFKQNQGEFSNSDKQHFQSSSNSQNYPSSLLSSFYEVFLSLYSFLYAIYSFVFQLIYNICSLIITVLIAICSFIYYLFSHLFALIYNMASFTHSLLYDIFWGLPLIFAFAFGFCLFGIMKKNI